MKKIFFSLALCGATAWAQSSNYSNRMDENVKRFVEKQKNSTQNIKISSNKDILGRSLNGSKPLVFKVNPADYQTKKVVLTEFSNNNNTANYKAIYKRVEHINNTSRYFIDGTELSKSEFFFKAEKHSKDFLKGIRNSSNTRILNLTAQEIENELSKNKNVFISEYQEPKLLASNGADTYLRDYYIINRSGITNNALNKGFKGQNVNILFREKTVPDFNVTYTLSNFTWLGDNRCDMCPDTAKEQKHSALVYNVLHRTAPDAYIYGINQTPTEDIITTNDIHIINWSMNLGKTPNYTPQDRIADQLIYNTRVIGIAAAGNSGNSLSAASPSKGFNVISVGAVAPSTDSVISYTNTKNGTQFKNDKPEIVNYTNFRFPNGKEFSGTSAAAPYTAGMVADMLSQFPDLKKEPATVKAALLTWSTRAPKNPDFDYDKGTFKAQIPFYQKEPMNWVYSMWNGLTNNDFFNKNNKIIFTDSFTKGKRYRVAISWLTNGEYKDTDDSISQDLNLIIKRNGKIIASSLSKNNTFELIDFEAPYTGEYTIEIFRYKNRNTNERVAIGYSRLEVQ